MWPFTWNLSSRTTATDRTQMATSTISLRNNFYRRNIKSTGTLRHVLCILQTTSWFTNLEQTLLNRNQQFLAPFKRLIDKIKRITGELTIWLTMDGCLTVTIDVSKCNNHITSLHSQLHHGLTDRWPTTCHDVIDQSGQYNQSTVYNTINWCDTTHFDSGDDYHTGCRNISHCQQQQSYSRLHSSRQSNSTYSWNDSWVQTFHSTI